MKPLRSAQACAAVFVVAVFAGCSQSTGAARDIEPRADQALRKMSTTLGRARSFSFRGDCVMDEAIGPHAPGQTAQYSRTARIVVRRPDRLFGEGEDGGEVFSFWYRAPDLTVLEKPANKTATVQVPGRIDAMLDEVAKKYGLTVPLADFLFSDPYKVLTVAVQSGRYVGQADVDGVKCDHLLFTEEIIDWQIWIAATSPAVPRKFAIDYKSVPARPQFTALLRDWNLSAAAGDEVFKPVIPADAKKVELAKLLRWAEEGA